MQRRTALGVLDPIVTLLPTDSLPSRNAMDNASKNAGDMIGSLQMKYNRGRQASITNELVDIITGASGMSPCAVSSYPALTVTHFQPSDQLLVTDYCTYGWLAYFFRMEPTVYCLVISVSSKLNQVNIEFLRDLKLPRWR